MRRMISLVLSVIMLGFTFLVPSHVLAAKHSFEFTIEGSKWLNDEKPFPFTGEKDNKFITGKFYVKESGKLMFDFYDIKGNLVLTHTKNVESIPEGNPFVYYTFLLDQDNLKGMYKVKVTCSEGTNVLGWLNY